MIFNIIKSLILITFINTSLFANEEIDEINKKIESSYKKEVYYSLENTEGDKLIEETAYTNEDYKMDKQIINTMFSSVDKETNEIIVKMFEMYKGKLEEDKNDILKVLPIALDMLSDKINNMKPYYVIKEKINKDNFYEINLTSLYYIDFENKKIIAEEEASLLQKNELFSLTYDNLYDYLKINWPRSRQMSEIDPKDYPIIIQLNNDYGIYFLDLEEKVNKQIKLVEEKGEEYINPFKNTFQ